MNMGGKEVMDIKPGNIPCVGSEHGGTRLLQHTDDDNEGFICSIKCDSHPTSVITACQIRFVYYMVQFMIWQNESGMILFRGSLLFYKDPSPKVNIHVGHLKTVGSVARTLHFGTNYVKSKRIIRVYLCSLEDNILQGERQRKKKIHR